MTDPRLFPANDRVASSELRGQIDGLDFVVGVARQVSAPVADLLRRPDGAMDCQLLRGADFRVLESDPQTGYSFGQSVMDGYVGYVKTSGLSEPRKTTHLVHSLLTHAYETPDIKTRPRAVLSFGSRVTAVQELPDFFELQDGSFLPRQHLHPISKPGQDPVEYARRFLGVPYLWGGNSAFGIDCSGLMQQALGACAIPCPRDSDMQETGLGRALDPDEPAEKGDFIFWKGHVGMMSDRVALIHANAFHMAVVEEPLSNAVQRIAETGGGRITGRRRL